MTAAGRVRLLAMLVAIAIACGGDDPVVERTQVPTSDGVVAPGDPLLERARASIHDGRIDPAIVEALRGSDAPAHARARRLLEAIAGEDVPVDLDRGEATPNVAAPLVAPTAGDPAPVPEPASPSSASSPASPSQPTTPRSTGRRELAGLSMSAAKSGATLTIKAPGAVTVGVANQLSSGIVHLVIEGATASPKVIGARPKIPGAAVTAVRKGQGSVQITLQLDPGWKLDRVDSFTGGARVRLRAPT